MIRLRLVCALAMLALAACRTISQPPPGGPRPTVVVEEPEAWRGIASARDAAALDGLAARWDQALAATRTAGLGRRIAGEGALLVRGARLARAVPAPGSYRCRSIRLGARRWTASAQGFCYVGVQSGQLSLSTELRGLRLGGYLWELKAGDRLVFLGAALPSGASSPPAYGDNPALDTGGVFERIGEFRYRLVLPEAAPGGGVTIVDLVAAPRT